MGCLSLLCPYPKKLFSGSKYPKNMLNDSENRSTGIMQGCMGCLSLLCQDHELLKLFHAHGGIRIVTDVLGPPPPGLVIWEFREYDLWMRHHPSLQPHTTTNTGQPQQISVLLFSKLNKIFSGYVDPETIFSR